MFRPGSFLLQKVCDHDIVNLISLFLNIDKSRKHSDACSQIYLLWLGVIWAADQCIHVHAHEICILDKETNVTDVYVLVLYTMYKTCLYCQLKVAQRFQICSSVICNAQY